VNVVCPTHVSDPCGSTSVCQCYVDARVVVQLRTPLETHAGGALCTLIATFRLTLPDVDKLINVYKHHNITFTATNATTSTCLRTRHPDVYKAPQMNIYKCPNTYKHLRTRRPIAHQVGLALTRAWHHRQRRPSGLHLDGGHAPVLWCFYARLLAAHVLRCSSRVR
jgi:hypothetical protein